MDELHTLWVCAFALGALGFGIFLPDESFAEATNIDPEPSLVGAFYLMIVGLFYAAAPITFAWSSVVLLVRWFPSLAPGWLIAAAVVAFVLHIIVRIIGRRVRERMQKAAYQKRYANNA